MKLSRLILLSCIFGSIMYSAFASIIDIEIAFSPPPPLSSERVFENPDTAAVFKGGVDEMTKFIANTLRYPADATARNAQGLVVYSFTVETDGSLSNFDLVHHADSALDKEALRILKTMPNWIPAKSNNQVVRSKNFVPMYFQLKKKENPQNNSSETAEVEVLAENVAPARIFTGKIVEKPDIPPIFTGGSFEMHRFIRKTLRYPKEARESRTQGLVVYTFVVEPDGSLSNFDLIHHTDSALDLEALRILKAMPPWRPGKLKNEIVRTKSYVPMYFRLRNVKQNLAKDTTAPASAYSKTNSEIANSEVFSIVEKMPEYPYGEKELQGFIAHQLRYPKDALQEGDAGQVVCSFIVGADGSISNIEVVQGLNPKLDLEAMRVLSLMSNWIPGEKNGEKVNVRCMIPIEFSAEKEVSPDSTAASI